MPTPNKDEITEENRESVVVHRNGEDQPSMWRPKPWPFNYNKGQIITITLPYITSHKHIKHKLIIS